MSCPRDEAARYRLLRYAEFEFRTLRDARELAAELAGLCPDPERVSLGLLELMVNAIEHGNLEISFGEKSRLCCVDTWEEEVERRLSAPNFAGRFGSVRVSRTEDGISFVVSDQGQGFDWEKYLDFDAARALSPNGRGIALARRFAFADLSYQAPGNVVTAKVKLGGAS
jgi:anti-sigma regulatory factor (Ser/Thr protein kinase)